MLFSVGDLNQKISADSFTYYHCPSCSLVFLRPIPNDLSRYYDIDYPAYQKPQQEMLEKHVESERSKIELVKKYVTGGRLLEIGPSYGGFSYLAMKEGFDVQAIEMDSDCCAYLNEVVGVKCINTSGTADDIFAVLQELEPFQVITLWHVIEHLPDPLPILKALSAKLSPGGILVLAAPNPEGIEYKLFGKFWVHLDAPRHLYLITMSTMKACLKRFELEQVLISCRTDTDIALNNFGWFWISLEHLLKNVLLGKEQFISSSQTKGSYTSAMQSKKKKQFRPILRLFMGLCHLFYSLVIMPLAAIEGRGNSYTAVFKKPSQ